uniref:DNA alkylation repair protein n=1 Tax=Amphimedon queenslandica TaxID=400682 RepID=A0A1X7U655_AMPQE
MPKTKKRKSKATPTPHQAEEVPSTSVPVPEPVAPPTSLTPDDMARGRQLVKEFSLMLEGEVSKDKKKYSAYALQMEKYFRFKFKFYGFNASERRRIQKQWNGRYKNELKNRKTLLSTLYALWDEDVRDFQSFGCDLASENKAILKGERDEDVRESMMCLKHLLSTKGWWDTVDLLSSNALGHLVKTSPRITLPIVDEWIEDDNMWLRRSAILHQLNFKEKTDEERLFRYCLSRGHEEEFFIRKAIGWSLRQYARSSPEAVRKFVRENEGTLSELSVKEAMKHIQK